MFITTQMLADRAGLTVEQVLAGLQALDVTGKFSEAGERLYPDEAVPWLLAEMERPGTGRLLMEDDRRQAERERAELAAAGGVPPVEGRLPGEVWPEIRGVPAEDAEHYAPKVGPR